MNVFYLRNISLLFLFIISVFSGSAQRSIGITVEGKISVQQGAVDGAIIQIYSDGRRLNDYGVGADGNYKLELLYDHKYELIFFRKDNFTKKIAVDANVPRSVLNNDPLFPPFPLNLTLFSEIPGIDKTFSENTVLKIFYSEDVDNFISETYYNDAQIAQLIEQAILQSQMIDKESDYLSKLTRAEQAELRREYNQLLEQAAKEYSNEQFLAALDGYKAASQILPKEQFPKDRIAEINDLLGLMMAAAELDKAKQDRFDALIAEADQLFNQKQYQSARNSYNRALSIKPTDQRATQQLQAISDILRGQLQDEQYDDLITQADNSMRQLLYNDAINRFNEALKIKPNENYPKNRLEEINEILAKQAKEVEKQESYREAMLEGNTMFEKQFYDKASTSFENALKFVPDDEAATTKIANVRSIMKEIADKMMFDELVKSADKTFKKKEYEAALTDYTEAAAILPDDAYVNKQINEINQILQLVENFADLVFKADNQFINENYEASKSLYQKALEIQSDDKHSQNRISEIDGILVGKSLDQKYDDLIAQADGHLNGKDYTNAKNAYNEAISVKPAERYPKDKIAEIDAITQQIAKTNQEYQQSIAKADELLTQEDYQKAKAEYINAGSIKPEETYPAEMVAKVDGLIAEQNRLAEEAAAAEVARLAAIQAERDKNYSDAIARAEAFFNEQAYENARTEYRTALEIKPEETVPQQRLEEIGTLLAQLSAAQKTYEDAIAKADREFNREGFDAAITAYNEAKSAKPEEAYPDEQLAKIDSIVTTRAQLAEEAAAAEVARFAAIQAERDKNYSDAIARAEAFFNEQAYENARTEYRTALEIKPEETVPQQRLEEIGTLLAQLSAAQKTYEDAIAKADREFNREVFDAAIVAYNKAKSAKPEEAYPDEQLAKIDSIVTERVRLAEEAAAAEVARLAAIQAERDKNYSDAIARAEAFFNEQAYENARTEYRTALEIKPEETVPQQRLEEIGTLLAQLSAAQKTYEDAIAKADREFNREVFDAAIVAYNKAKSAKPEEAYPDEQLAKIDSIVTERAQLAEEAAAAEVARLAAIQAERDKNYSDAIARAEAFFNEQSYENARTEYRTALEIKPEETVPQQRLEEIGQVLAQLEEEKIAKELQDKNYNDFIAQADRFFTAKSYDQSKLNYNNALELKPDESYPNERISEIDEILAQRAIDEQYRTIIVAADGFFKTENYLQAKSEYETASALKPQEIYPKNQIAKIDDILQNEQQRILAEKAAEEDLQRRNDVIAQLNREIEVSELNSEAEITELYDQYIIQADTYFNEKQYNISRAWYYKAWDVKPNEAYPPQRIAEVNRLVGSLLSSQRDRDYQQFIDLADSTFRVNEYAVARGWYNRALSIKSNESYPKDQISEIENKIAERLAGQSGQQFTDNVEKASNAFTQGNYNVARFWYKKALELRPNDADVLKRLQDIQNQIR